MQGGLRRHPRLDPLHRPRADAGYAAASILRTLIAGYGVPPLVMKRRSAGAGGLGGSKGPLVSSGCGVCVGTGDAVARVLARGAQTLLTFRLSSFAK